MIGIKSRWNSVADQEKWSARTASFVAKLQATKAVWFPPKPAETGKKVASAAGKKTQRTAKKTTGTAKKTTAAARKRTGTTKRTSKKTA